MGRPSIARCFVAAAALLAATPGALPARPGDGGDGVRFREGFDDDRLPDGGWYDGREFVIAGEEARSGDGCIAYHWEPGTTTPEGSPALRRLFEPTEAVYVRFFLKLSEGWGWSGRPYHPHLIQLLTTENGKYQGPAASRLTVYVEPQEGRLRLAAQDIENRDAPHGPTQGPLRGGVNGSFFDSEETLFTDDAWHCVEAQFRLNTLDLERDRPNADGVVRAWFDGELVVDRSDVVLRSTDFPGMEFNQILLAPYFGPGLLPHEQTLRIDELVVGTRRPEDDPAADRSRNGRASMRVAAAQPGNRTIDFHLEPAEVLARVDRSLSELERLVHEAGDAGCDALAFPEDTLGLLNWEAAHPEALDAVLPEAVSRMLDRLGRAAAGHRMYLVLCSDAIDQDGRTYNTAFLLGRDGDEIGRYRKVNLPLTEQSRARGDEFPVFPTPDLGAVGMLICYDMIFPEAARCLALQGADVVVHPTLGGAAFGDDDISLAAFRTRAAENFVYLVVAMRGQGSMVISPRGRVLATAEGADALAIADIDPWGGREGGDAFNTQADLRGRLFRERVPGAYGLLTEPEPPVLAKVPSNVTAEEAIRIMATVLTTGEERFNRANELARSGDTEEAIRLFERLCEDCPTSWIERAARARIESLRPPAPVGTHEDP
ncbi:carbon-nitrogen hydrolase family protein [Tautonia plasticadhaerens]|uniref:(R)-stereoselective amidase n=1 Tax=Tautonia plasticadhaerens TaxID=2527974 RepID=A0A518HA74_9BACT|nr:carbon-nitrogen hydrolase family protein [Tautonia plasticadhaerens]QDV37751.1 (R)-stereoselective amidase [Tautonia plasticadhaerens]